jgi:hypothetical protein
MNLDLYYLDAEVSPEALQNLSNLTDDQNCSIM